LSFVGAGAAYGILPYVRFILEEVFLKFDSRIYSDPKQKWEIASLSLDILHHIISKFTLEGVRMPIEQLRLCHHGYYVVEKLLSGGNLFKKVVSVFKIDGGVSSLIRLAQDSRYVLIFTF
jgi:hypothetical protein